MEILEPRLATAIYPTLEFYRLFRKSTGKFSTKTWNRLGDIKNHIRVKVPRGGTRAASATRAYLEDIEIVKFVVPVQSPLTSIIPIDIEGCLRGGSL